MHHLLTKSLRTVLNSEKINDLKSVPAPISLQKSTAQHKPHPNIFTCEKMRQKVKA